MGPSLSLTESSITKRLQRTAQLRGVMSPGGTGTQGPLESGWKVSHLTLRLSKARLLQISPQPTTLERLNRTVSYYFITLLIDMNHVLRGSSHVPMKDFWPIVALIFTFKRATT